MACLISVKYMNSLAVWERDELPGPNLTDCHGIKAWSLRVGEPKGVAPSNFMRSTIG